MFKNNLLSVKIVKAFSVYFMLISTCCAVLTDSYILTAEELEDFDNNVDTNKRSILQNQNFLTRPRPGKREVYKVLFFNKDIQRHTNEFSNPYYNKRSEILQNFLTRPRPGKREIFVTQFEDEDDDGNYMQSQNLEDRQDKRSEENQNFLTRPRPGKREQNQNFLVRPRPGKRVINHENGREAKSNSYEFIRELEHYIIKSILKNNK